MAEKRDETQQQPTKPAPKPQKRVPWRSNDRTGKK